MAKKRKNPLLPYENKWVALTPNRKKVVASAATVEVLDRKLTKLKNKDAILTKVPSFDKFISP